MAKDLKKHKPLYSDDFLSPSLESFKSKLDKEPLIEDDSENMNKKQLIISIDNYSDFSLKYISSIFKNAIENSEENNFTDVIIDLCFSESLMTNFIHYRPNSNQSTYPNDYKIRITVLANYLSELSKTVDYNFIVYTRGYITEVTYWLYFMLKSNDKFKFYFKGNYYDLNVESTYPDFFEFLKEQNII